MPKTIFTAKNILKAYFDCRKTKRKTANALKYELNLENNLSGLKKCLLKRSYTPGRSICFIVTTPKPREIFAADFKDRIVHHLLINEVESIWEKKLFIEDSYACRKGKGHHFAVKKVSEFAKKYRFYGQFDIANFFGCIDKNILFHCFKKVIIKEKKPKFWQEEILWLAKTIIFNDPTQKFRYKGDPALKKLLPQGKSLFDQKKNLGLPIGNLTSQFFANVYLNELDHFVKDKLDFKAYGRYVDDFVLFSNSKEEIIFSRNEIKKFLQSRLHLTLHPKKQQIQPTAHGLPFVGYFIKPWGVTVRRNVVKSLKNKIYQFNQQSATPKTLASLNSYFGHLGKAKTYRLRRHLILAHLSGEFKSKVKVVKDFHHLRPKPEEKTPSS